MSLVINSNFMAMNAARNLGSHFGALETSTRRLSSGLRISQASDDAAGLAVRELMRADISSLQQGIRNANDAISLIQTADGALSVVDEKLIRMKELAMQASTGTYNSDQRVIIDSEFQAMAREITRIANSTDFNGIYLLNGGLSGAHSGAGMNSTGRLKVHFGTGNDCSEDYYYIQIDCCTASALGFSTSTTMSQYAASRGLSFYNSYSLAPSGLFSGSSSYLYNVPQSVKDQFDMTTAQTISQYYTSDTRTFFLQDRSGDMHAITTNIADESFGSDVNLANMTTSVSTQQLAQQALATVNNAIVSKDKIRAHLGALQNRMQNTVDVLEIQAENMRAAESRISDVDVATEMTEFVKNQILTQAAVSMLSQANSLPRMALSLIG